MKVNLAAVASVVGILLIVPACVHPKRYHVMKFLHISDFHFDPFYDKSWSVESYCHTQGSNATADYEAPYGRIGCDSPESLLDSSLQAMKKHGDGVKFIILSGDSSAHGLTDDHGSKNVLNSMKIVSEKLHEFFPEIPVFPVFGNNDLPGHYVLPNSSEWYETVLSYWAPLILCPRCPADVKEPTTMEDLKETFLEGGYYSANIVGRKMVLLALNTMYWNNNWYTNDMVERIANDQFIWLENQLQEAKRKRKKVLLMGHIPPGGDPFDGSFFWVPQYARRYVEIVAGKFHNVVAGQLYGHTHKDDFHLQILDSTRKSFVLMAPSVSPVYSNNPAFRVVSLDTKKKALLDYDQYYFDLVIATEFSNPVWQRDYTFSKKYPSRNRFVNANRIDTLNQQLISQSDGTYWKEYIFSTYVNYQTGPYIRFEKYCVMRHVFEDDFKKCRDKFKVPGG